MTLIWYKGFTGLAKTGPRPFERMPIIWERAFGGTEADTATGALAVEARNPIGRGFATAASLLVDKPLPNVEDILHPIRGWKDRPPPAGLGAIAPDWSPRRERGGTYDEVWKRTRVPLWPQDYDPRFHQSAPAGLVSEPPLKGGETVSTTGLVPEGKLVFRLPREYLVVETQLGNRWVRQPVQLERVIVEPDERRVVMVWGSRLDCRVRARQVSETRISIKPWVTPR